MPAHVKLNYEVQKDFSLRGEREISEVQSRGGVLTATLDLLEFNLGQVRFWYRKRGGLAQQGGTTQQQGSKGVEDSGFAHVCTYNGKIKFRIRTQTSASPYFVVESVTCKIEKLKLKALDLRHQRNLNFLGAFFGAHIKRKVEDTVERRIGSSLRRIEGDMNAVADDLVTEIQRENRAGRTVNARYGEDTAEAQDYKPSSRPWHRQTSTGGSSFRSQQA